MKIGPKRILVREPNWVGDNIFTLPAVQELKKMHPAAHLTILAKAGLGAFWEMVPEVDEVVSYDLRGGLKDCGKKWRLIRSLRRKGFDLAVIFPRSFESALWMWLAGIPHRWGYREEARSLFLTRHPKSRRGYRHTHRVDYYYHLLDNAGSDAPAPLARLGVPAYLTDWGRSFLEKETGGYNHEFLVGLHPRASHGPAKCWPLEYYARLAELLSGQRKTAVLVFGKEHEKEMAQTVVRAGGSGVFNLAGKTNLKQLAAVVKLCHGFVANDTGPLHLAAALGVPVIGLFGSSDPAATAPRGRYARVSYKNVPCSPCLKRFCPTDFKCMTSITPEEILSLIEEIREKVREQRREAA